MESYLSRITWTCCSGIAAIPGAVGRYLLDGILPLSYYLDLLFRYCGHTWSSREILTRWNLTSLVLPWLVVQVLRPYLEQKGDTYSMESYLSRITLTCCSGIAAIPGAVGRYLLDGILPLSYYLDLLFRYCGHTWSSREILTRWNLTSLVLPWLVVQVLRPYLEQ